MSDNSNRKIETVKESFKRQRINYVKQIINENINKYVNYFNSETGIDTFANNLVTKNEFPLGIGCQELENLIEFYLPPGQERDEATEAYSNNAMRTRKSNAMQARKSNAMQARKSKKGGKKSKKVRKSKKSKKHHKRKSRKKRR